MTIYFQKFSLCWIFCFAYSLSKMALKLTSKIPIQVFFRNSSFFPAISDNLWLGGKHSWLWIGSAGFKSRLDQKFFIWYFCCLMFFHSVINTAVVKNVVYQFFGFLEAWKSKLGNIYEEKKNCTSWDLYQVPQIWSPKLYHCTIFANTNSNDKI